jgi:hypothetical protein
MNYAVLVEGPDDERFIENIVKPAINHRRFNTMQYSEEPDGTVNAAISAFQGMHRDMYLLRDYDHGKQNCTSISGRKEFVQNKFNAVDKNQIIIVDDTIEAWYLAGLTDSNASELGIQVPSQTGQIGKSEFNNKLSQSRFSSKVNFQMNIIERYSIQEAKNSSSSFNYFTGKIGL